MNFEYFLYVPETIHPEIEKVISSLKKRIAKEGGRIEYDAFCQELGKKTGLKTKIVKSTIKFKKPQDQLDDKGEVKKKAPRCFIFKREQNLNEGTCFIAI